MDAAAKILAFLFLIQSIDAEPTKAKVLILGAGAAGIGFARRLYESGEKDFLILEAQNYIGGRIRSVEFQDVTVEAGANWIHGIGKDNPFYVLRKRFALQATIDDYSDFVVR